VDTAFLAWWRCRGLPSQTKREIQLTSDALLAAAQPLRVFEWGSGLSTSYYTRLLAKAGRDFQWHSVDHSRSWHERVLRRVGEDPRVHLYCFPFRNPWEIDVCRLEDHPEADNASRYVMLPVTIGERFDVMLVDGRFRRRCVLVARDTLRPHGVVILHDAYRSYYRSACGVFPHGELISGGYLPGSVNPSQSWLGRL